MRIGPIQINPHQALLAPMAGVTDRVFRQLCRQQGCAFCYTEMVSAKGLCYGGKESWELLRPGAGEEGLGVQLFGAQPDYMAKAIAQLEDLPFALVDINMGCPVKKVVSNGEGSALMRDLPAAAKVLKAAVRATSKPVTVKIRKGWDDSQANAAAFARMAQDCGVAAITVHGRTRQQMYAGKADWDIIAAVKAAVNIPVIGNGDIRSGADVLAMRRQTGCDAVMVGRAAMGNPWIFQEIAAVLSGGPAPPPVTAAMRIDLARRHLAALAADKGEKAALLEMRKHLCWELRGLPGAAALRAQLHQAASLDQLQALLERLQANTERW